MARGKSGRIVVEIAPDLKEQLYVVLAKRGMTMKGWFEEKARKAVGSQKESRRAQSGRRRKR